MFYLTIGILTRNTTRTYNVQTQAETGVANPPRALAKSLPPPSRRTSDFIPRVVLPPRLMGHTPFTDTTSVSYHDVVASRPPSRREETTALILARSSEDADSRIVPNRSMNETLFIVSRDSHHEGRLTSSETKFLLPKDSEGDEWTTVNHRRRVRSPGSKERTRIASKEIVHNVHAPIKAKEQMLKPEAAKRLTAFEKQEWTSQLRRRENSLAIQRRDSLCRCKRPSSNENENCVDRDTQKWVQMDVTHLVRDSESLNIAAQMLAAALNSLNQWNKKATDKNMCRERKREKTHQSSHPRTSQPAKAAKTLPAARSANSTGDYYFQVGVVLWDVGRRHASQFVLRQKHPSSSPPDSRFSADVSEKSNLAYQLL
jgi:hypothetical protein